VANAKRQRQDLLRAEKLAREAATQKEAVRKTKLKRFGLIGGVLALAVLALLFFTRGGDDVTTDGSAASASAGAPKVTVPDGEAPTKTEAKDLRVGAGEAVQKGDTIRVKYTGVAWSTKKQFDSNWDDDTNVYTVTNIGNEPRSVIDGWDSLIGAKVGGRRQLVIPPAQAYGAEGKSPIGPNETLVFVIDVLSREKG
jgi:peptidylprolyl isomerase